MTDDLARAGLSRNAGAVYRSARLAVHLEEKESSPRPWMAGLREEVMRMEAFLNEVGLEPAKEGESDAT